VTRRTALVLAGLTALAGLGVLSGLAVLSVTGGLMLAFVLPGMALTTALFRERISLTTVERLMLVPALSLATLVLGGLAAWGAGLPLQRATWLGISGLATLAALATTVIWPVPAPVRTARAAAVRAKLPTPGDSTLILPVFLDRAGQVEQAPQSRWGRMMPARTVLPLALAALMLAGAGWYSVWTSVRIHDVQVTGLSAAPSMTANDVGDRAVTVTATGLSAGTAYALEVVGPTGDVSTRHTLTAPADGTWTGTVTVPGGERTTIGLYRSGDTTAYRTVIIAAN
jgi:hypothetical protein